MPPLFLSSFWFRKGSHIACSYVSLVSSYLEQFSTLKSFLSLEVVRRADLPFCQMTFLLGSLISPHGEIQIIQPWQECYGNETVYFWVYLAWCYSRSTHHATTAVVALTIWLCWCFPIMKLPFVLWKLISSLRGDILRLNLHSFLKKFLFKFWSVNI